MTDVTATNADEPVAGDAHARTVGNTGPIVLHDHYTVEKLAQFNRERVPERVVHAKGGGAFGTFVTENDVSAYTRAALFQPGAETEMLIRFSTVTGEQGSPDTWRDPRGFSVKLYTTEGNEDLTAAEADEAAGQDADFHRRDLYEAIENGDHPAWTLYVQVMPYEEAATYRFNPFDLTKVWQHADYPLIKVGTMTLSRNPENFHAQIEQAAFAPSNFVPGIDASPDTMLLARIFSYADAHRYRVGTNHADLPVNAPKSQVNSYSKDGATGTPTAR